MSTFSPVFPAGVSSAPMRHLTRITTLAVVALALFSARPALALPPGIYITPEPLDTSAPTFEKTLAKSKRNYVVQENGKWHFHFVAYLNKPAPADQLFIVFYDAKVKGKQEPNAFPINTKAGAKIIGSESSVSPEDGIKAGPYNVRITFVDKGKELIYAQTRLDLKPPAPAAPAK